MTRGIELLKFIALLGLMIFLFSFSNKRNEKRKVYQVDVEFTDETSPFIDYNTVNKLLIQSQEGSSELRKEALDLRRMEQRLQENPMVRTAEVFVSVDGALGARVEQRNPIGRIAAGGTGADYYLDADGKKMPLSTVYSARVPIITGTSKTDFNELTALLLKIREDDFMKSSVVGLNQNSNGEIELSLRKSNLKVLFGKPDDIENKFQNFKAFYKKTKQDSTLYGYEKVNLKFESQVIATKK